jgi:hypothetical protein
MSIEISEFKLTLFTQLSSLVIDEVVDQGLVLRVRARTPGTVVACPQCGEPTERVHGYHQRRSADLPVGGWGCDHRLPGPASAVPNPVLSAAHIPGAGACTGA